MTDSTLQELEHRIDELFASRVHDRSPEDLVLLAEFRAALNGGFVRVAEPEGGSWKVHPWVKRGILLHSMLGRLRQEPSHNGDRPRFEFDTMEERALSIDDGVRAPGVGCWIRDGAFLAPGVSCMPPLVINMGAYVESETQLDSHSMVGLCVQIGKRVVVSCGSKIGGRIVPVEALPNIIEDDVLICGDCSIYDGVIIERGAILGPGTILSSSIPVYDISREQVYRGNDTDPLRIPAGAVVVPAARQITHRSALSTHLMLQVPCIIGYRDDNDSTTSLLERWLA